MSRFLKVGIIESGIIEYGVVESGIVNSGVLGWGCNAPKSPYHRYFHENRPKTSQNARNSVNYCHENRPKVSKTAINSVKCSKTLIYKRSLVSKKSLDVQTRDSNRMSCKDSCTYSADFLAHSSHIIFTWTLFT